MDILSLILSRNKTNVVELTTEISNGEYEAFPLNETDSAFFDSMEGTFPPTMFVRLFYDAIYQSATLYPVAMGESFGYFVKDLLAQNLDLNTIGIFKRDGVWVASFVKRV